MEKLLREEECHWLFGDIKLNFEDDSYLAANYATMRSTIFSVKDRSGDNSTVQSNYKKTLSKRKTWIRHYLYSISHNLAHDVVIHLLVMHFEKVNLSCQNIDFCTIDAVRWYKSLSMHARVFADLVSSLQTPRNRSNRFGLCGKLNDDKDLRKAFELTSDTVKDRLQSLVNYVNACADTDMMKSPLNSKALKQVLRISMQPNDSSNAKLKKRKVVSDNAKPASLCNPEVSHALRTIVQESGT